MALKERKVIMIPTKALDVDPSYNCREDYGDLTIFKEGIIENGIVTPLVVRPVEQEDGSFRYTVISGHRRREAVRQLVEEDGYEDFSVPVLCEDLEDEKKLLARLIIDNDYKVLSPLEESMIFFKMAETGLTIRRIAEMCGRSKSTVGDYLLLASADEELKELVRSGGLTVTGAIKQLRKSEEGEGLEPIDEDAFGGEEQETKEGDGSVRSEVDSYPKEGKDTKKRGGSVTVERLELLLEQMEELDQEGRKSDAFAALEGIIKWAVGDLSNGELTAYFFDEEKEFDVTTRNLAD